MILVRRLASFGCLAVALAAPFGAWLASAEPADEAGAALYRRYCAACHGVKADGDGPLAAVLNVPPSDLTRIAARRGGHFPSSEVREIIDGRRPVRAHGPGEMPVWGAVLGQEPGTDDIGVATDLGMLTAYLESIQKP